MNKKQRVSYLIDGCAFLLGSFLFACSVNIFTAPNQIAPGGLTGAAVLLHYLGGPPIGIGAILLNIPLFLWGFRELGWQTILKSGFGMLSTSVFIDLTAPVLPVYQGDLMLASIFAGVLSGGGLSLIFLRGGTTGGTDLAANLLSRHFRHLSLGRLLTVIDFFIVAISAFVFQNLESPMYAVIVIVVTAKVIDTVLFGADSGVGKVAFIFSSDSQRIEHDILTSLDRGVTALQARGSYSKRKTDVLLCAIRRQELHRLNQIIHAADPDAFVIVADAGEITGEGFRAPDKK